MSACRCLPAGKHRHHVQPGVGHYGLFNGRRWTAEIYPVVKDHIRQSERSISRPAVNRSPPFRVSVPAPG
ncbi:MAG: hypothetical protein ACLPJJ_08850 [Acidocella sp.]|uniref:hypothetical protein n=1 Tax=Acidocella sp. TaxID=50710 RepID=UPI003FC54163